jgi:glycine cleavage system transcriptional repressor
MIVRLLPRVPTLNQCVMRTAKVYFSSSHAGVVVDKKTYLMINTLGPDRLGIVSDMTKLITDVGGSVGESQATKLGSYFLLTMQVSVPSKAAAENLKKLLTDESVMGIMMSTHSVETNNDPKSVQVGVVSPSVGGYSGRFVLSGADQPGHVHKVTSLLVKHGLSIDTMDTSEEEAPLLWWHYLVPH